MDRRQLKKQLISLLSSSDLHSIYAQLDGFPQKALLNPLFIALCHPLEKVRWHAVCCFGKIVSVIAGKDFEAARVVMRRFLWTLNDESGGIGWGAPESMGEIMCHNRQLREEYLHMLISYMREDGEELYQDGNYLELPLLQRGLLWGVGRLCQVSPGQMVDAGVVDDLVAYLDSPDMQVRGMALWALSHLNTGVASADVLSLLDSTASLQLFSDGAMHTIAIADLARTVAEIPTA
ncbi:MAG: HEAT repeat domain-containing protein [Desulfobulbaceae bacterium]|nr:HEAT repeat domain-containing protein [Desulfobulbaceae bacterium]